MSAETLWPARAAAAGAVWLGPTLQNALMPTLGAKAFFLPDPDGDDGIVWQLFKRGPFRLGYIGFPLGGTLRGETVGAVRISRLLASDAGRQIQLLRVVGSAFNAPEGLDTQFIEQLPETKILHLQQFEPLRNGSIRRNIARASESGVVVAPADSIQHADTIFLAYSKMVIGHGGAPKYTRDYFTALTQMSLAETRLVMLIATVNGQFAGFLSAVLDSRVGYYLHSAVLPAFRQLRVTDALMFAALTRARETGLEEFNFMASPPNQPNLVRFKEKWGGVTQIQNVFELRPRRLMSAIMLAGSAFLNRKTRVADE